MTCFCVLFWNQNLYKGIYYFLMEEMNCLNFSYKILMRPFISVIINEVYPVKIFWLQISFYLDMSFNLSHFGSCVVKHWKSAYRAVSINGQIQNWTSVYHYALDIYKCNITVHYYIHRVYTTNSTFTSFLFTYIFVLSENSTYTFKYKIEVLSSPSSCTDQILYK